MWEFKTCLLASSEGDDAADRIVRGNTDRHPVTRHHLDSEAAHPAAQLCKNLVALVTLHAIQAATMHRDDGALHIDQIILAQALSFPNKDCAIFDPEPQSEPTFVAGLFLRDPKTGTLNFSVTFRGKQAESTT